MANILYRASTTPTVPGSTTAKGTPLTNLEGDGNLKSINDDLALKATTSYVDGNLKSINDDLALKATTSYVDGQISAINSAKNAVSGYAGLDASYRIQFKNVAGTFTSLFSNTNTAARTYSLPDRDGTLADGTDLAAKASLNSSPTFTGSVTATSFVGNLNWSYIQSKPTTISGYGITDAITTANIGSQSVASATNATNLNGSGTISDNTTIGGSKVGFRDVPQNSQAAGYTLVMGDSGKHIYMNSTGNFIIPPNTSVAFPVGTAITFYAATGSACTISSTDSLILAGAGTTGTKTLAGYGIATALKITSTSWVVSGSGLS